MIFSKLYIFVYQQVITSSQFESPNAINLGIPQM